VVHGDHRRDPTKIFVLGRSGWSLPSSRGRGDGGSADADRTVGPGFTITLTKGGKKVTRLSAGRYQLVVRDRSTMHSFVLEDRGSSETSRPCLSREQRP
jgi:hypothetical protein